MKKRSLRLILASIAVLFFMLGCTAQQQSDYSHWKSDLIGLNRKITLYSNGRPLQVWEGRFKVEISYGVARFIHDGKAVIINGTYVIEEK